MEEKNDILKIKEIIEKLDSYELDEKVNFINAVRQMLHKKSPFANEPVDCVLWVKSDTVVANDYNPNKVAPPEMQLLEVSIDNDGYTQPKSEAYEKFKQIKSLRLKKESITNEK